MRKARREHRPPLTQAELSKRLSKLGVSVGRAGIAKIETGIRGVLDYEVLALAKALSKRTSWLLSSME